MSYQQQVIALVKSISGQANILTIPRVYIAITGNVNCALILSQLVYWSDRTKNAEGWIYKSYREWTREIGLTQFEVSHAVGKLRDLGLIETRLKKANRIPTIHYRVDFGILTNLIIKKLDNQETLQVDYQETSQLPIKKLDNPLTETTTEPTTEIHGGEGKSPPNVFDVYERNIGALTPIISEALAEDEAEYSAEWVCAALTEAAKNEKRSLNYAEAILKRWKREGFQSPYAPKNGRAPSGSKPANRDLLAGIKEFLEEHGNE